MMFGQTLALRKRENPSFILNEASLEELFKALNASKNLFKLSTFVGPR